MTMAIVAHDSENGGRQLSLAGHLSGDAVAVLAEAVSGAPRDLTLDLSDLKGFDGPGEALLRRLRSNGALLVRLTPFVALMLASDPA
jgi:ABC-type transporter Mla MlaB component